MTAQQKKEAVQFFSGWLEKVSVGCLVVGLFQTEHLAGGLAGAAIAFVLGLTLKIRGAK